MRRSSYLHASVSVEKHLRSKGGDKSSKTQKRRSDTAGTMATTGILLHKEATSEIATAKRWDKGRTDMRGINMEREIGQVKEGSIILIAPTTETGNATEYPQTTEQRRHQPAEALIYSNPRGPGRNLKVVTGRHKLERPPMSRLNMVHPLPVGNAAVSGSQPPTPDMTAVIIVDNPKSGADRPIVTRTAAVRHEEDRIPEDDHDLGVQMAEPLVLHHPSLSVAAEATRPLQRSRPSCLEFLIRVIQSRAAFLGKLSNGGLRCQLRTGKSLFFSCVELGANSRPSRRW